MVNMTATLGKFRKNALIYFMFSMFSLTALAKDHQIQVKLFGNICLLKGPVTEASLRAVHAVSPEQLPPVDSVDQIKAQIQRVQSVTSLPPLLSEYRDKIQKRLEAWAGFYDALSALKQDSKSDAIYIVSKKFIATDRQASFESTLKTLLPKDSTKGLSSSTVDQIKETYERYIESDPQEEFHRVIRKLKIQYICSFEDTEGEDAE